MKTQKAKINNYLDIFEREINDILICAANSNESKKELEDTLKKLTLFQECNIKQNQIQS